MKNLSLIKTAGYRLALAVLGLFVFEPMFAQLEMDMTLTPSQLVQNVLLGPAVSVSNVTFNGQPGDNVNLQLGRFEGQSNVLSISQGIFMCSGPADQIIGSFSMPSAFYNGDPDLFQLAGNIISTSSVVNQAVLEFDFVPLGDSLLIDFVFMSHEYPDYTCSYFNDPFGFFISGPGIEGPFSNNAKNIALVPGSNAPIAVNSINGGVPTGGGSMQNCFSINPNFVGDSQYFVGNDPMAVNDVQFPGMTVTLTAGTPLICGETYHIKLAIADINDSAFDSGVLLAGGGFKCSYSGLTAHPEDMLAFVGESVEFSVQSSVSSNTYQWQIFSETEFVDLNEGGQFSGTTEPTLTVSNLTEDNDGQQFRCMIFTESCVVPSGHAVLNLIVIGVEELTNDMVSVFPNPASESLTINTPAELNGSLYTITDLTGRAVMQGMLTNTSTTLSLSGVPRGAYQISINVRGRMLTQRIFVR